MLKRLGNQLPLLVVLFLALVLRLPLLNSSFWLDEAAQALESMRPWSEQLHIPGDFQPPLLHLLVHLATRVSVQEWWLRTIGALIPGLLTIWGTYLLGKKIVGQKVALTASLFLATSSFHLFFAQELRPYSLSACWAIWSWFFLLEATKFGQDIYQLAPKNPVNRFFNLFPISRDAWLALALTILGLYTSYLYPFVLASQLLYLFWTRRFRLSWYFFLIPAVAFLPWLPAFRQQLELGQSLRQNLPGWEEVVSFSLLKAPALTFGKFLFGVIDLSFITPNLEIAYPFVLATGIFCLLVLSCLLARPAKFYRRHAAKFWLLFFLLIVPFVLASLVSLVVPVIQPKRVIFLLPVAYIFLAFIIFGTRESWQLLKLKNWLLLLLVLAFNFYGVWAYYTIPAYGREPWRSAVATLHETYEPRETMVVFAFNEPFAPWTFYERRYEEKFPTLVTGELTTDDLDLTTVLEPALGYRQVIVFDYLRSLTDRQNAIPGQLESWGLVETATIDQQLLGFIRVYQQPGGNKLER